MTDILIKIIIVIAIAMFITGLVLWVQYDNRVGLLLSVLAFIFFYAGG